MRGSVAGAVELIFAALGDDGAEAFEALCLEYGLLWQCPECDDLVALDQDRCPECDTKAWSDGSGIQCRLDTDGGDDAAV